MTNAQHTRHLLIARLRAIAAAEADLLGEALEALAFASGQLDELINRHYGGELPCADAERAGFEKIQDVLTKAGKVGQ